jgi:AcrR family transcriptional regulator
MTLPAVQIFDPAAMAAARQEALLVAASWLFNLKGVDATPLDEIAQRVGVTKKVIYHNLGDKQALVAQCYRRAFHLYENIGARMRAYDGTRIDALTASAHALAEASLREDIAPFRPFTGFEARPQPERDEIQAAAERLSATYMEAFSQGKAEGSIGEVDAAAILELLPGLFEWLPKWFDLFTEEARARAPRELAEFFQLGMRPL